MLTTHRNNAKHIPDLNLSGLFQTMPIIFIGSCVKGHYSGTLMNPKYTLNQDADFIATQFQHYDPLFPLESWWDLNIPANSSLT